MVSLFLNMFTLALVAISMAASVYLFISLKKEIHESAARRAGAESELARELGTLNKRLQEMERELADSTLSGMTLTKRSQTLRRMRRGEAPEQIASALSIPLREVELLIKVEEKLNGPTSCRTSDA